MQHALDRSRLTSLYLGAPNAVALPGMYRFIGICGIFSGRIALRCGIRSANVLHIFNRQVSNDHCLTY
jgi:hypothetical protein